jgi:hypothetical protein
VKRGHGETGAGLSLPAPDELPPDVYDPQQMADLHPAHALYVLVLNLVSYFAEQLAATREMERFADILQRAEDEYVPDGPPVSPLTRSYFNLWAFFDARAGRANETIGSVILEMGRAFHMDEDLLRVIALLQESRMGLYRHEGRAGAQARLREFVTGEMRDAMVPAGYDGAAGEIWYARVLPPPIPGGSQGVVMTTPYIVVEPDAAEWEAYFRRAVPGGRREEYERHMKYGPRRHYWNDYVFESYVNHQAAAIYCAGLPDVPESRPHARVNER